MEASGPVGAQIHHIFGSIIPNKIPCKVFKWTELTVNYDKKILVFSPVPKTAHRAHDQVIAIITTTVQ